MIIHNQNIPALVYNYCKDKSKLPEELKGIPIGKWDVSQVTIFDNVFMYQDEFDEPLSWDVSNAISMNRMFSGCKKFNQSLTWNVEKVTSMLGMFRECKVFNKPLKWKTKSLLNAEYMFYGCTKFNETLDFDMSQVTQMSNMFTNCFYFNKPLEWDVSSARNMTYMFKGCDSFNQSLKWDVSHVTDMTSMFEFCCSFNSPLKGTDTPHWNVRRVMSIKSMFYGCTVFNQHLKWDTHMLSEPRAMFMLCPAFNQPVEFNMSDVKDIAHMFHGCTSFNQPLNWDVAEVENMNNLFADCESFNQPLDWDLSNATKMNDMFYGCSSFNSPLTGKTEPHWNVSKVFTLSNMFKNCRKFNQPLVWNVSRVQDMFYMFCGCRKFNQPLDWNVNRVESFEGMFLEARRFDQDLTSWAILDTAATDAMFSQCGIRPAFKPTLPGENASPEPVGPPVKVNAYQVHKFSAKVDILKLNEFFHSRTAFRPDAIEDYPSYIRVSMAALIDSLETNLAENEKKLDAEIKTLQSSIEKDSLETILTEVSELNLPLKSVQRWEEHCRRKITLLHKIQTTKSLTHISTYVKKIDNLLSKPSSRTEALEEQKALLLEFDALDKTMKRMRFDKNKKDLLTTLVDRKIKTIELIGRKTLLEHELKHGKIKIVKHRKDLEKLIRNVLNNLDYDLYSKEWILSIGYSLDYVEKQSILFKEVYVESFLKDCLHAYEGAGGISCATGVLERFVLSLMAGCGACLSVSENPEYEYIKGIIENGLTKLIPDYILKWYKLHSHDPHRFTTETKEQRLDNLRAYLVSFFPDNDALIDKIIPEYAISVDNDDFEYKKENTGDAARMNNVYVNVIENAPVTKVSRKVPKRPAAPRRTRRTKPSTNELVTNVSVKPNASVKANSPAKSNAPVKTRQRTKPLPKPRTKSNVKTKKVPLGPAPLGTAFG